MIFHERLQLCISPKKDQKVCPEKVKSHNYEKLKETTHVWWCVDIYCTMLLVQMSYQYHRSKPMAVGLFMHSFFIVSRHTLHKCIPFSS